MLATFGGEHDAVALQAHRADIEKLFAAQVADAAIGRMFGCDRRTVAKMHELWEKKQK